MTLENSLAAEDFARLFEGNSALSLEDQLRNIVQICERHDIVTFAKMVSLKHAGHDEILKLTPEQAERFIEDIDLFLTVVISMARLKQ